MEPNLQPGDEVDVTQGDFANFRATVERIDGNIAEVLFSIFGKVHGPIRIPVELLRKIEPQ